MLDRHSISAAYLLSALDQAGIGYDTAIAHLLAHRSSFTCPRLGVIMREVIVGMRHRRTGHSQTRHVRVTLVTFFHSLTRAQRDHPGSITREHIISYLRRWDRGAVKTWNEQLAYITSAFALAVRRGWLSSSPCAQIERKRAEKHRPPAAVLEPFAALELLRWLQVQAPEWIPYFAFCLFAGIRPDVREGEAHRLDEDLRSQAAIRRPALDADGFWLRGKDGRVRHVPWSICGPLRSWLNAYPMDTLIPAGLSYAQAERALQGIRARFSLTHDIMRHTAASAMLNAPAASFAQVALALGNSERMLTRHYAGIWNPGKTAALYAITPVAGPAPTLFAVA